MAEMVEATTLRLVEETMTTARMRWPSARLTASLCDTAVLALIVLVVRGSAQVAIVDGVAWGVATLMMAPRTLPGAESLRATVTGVFHAAMLVGMGTFALGALISLPHRILVVVTLIGLFTGVLIRVIGFIARSRPRMPLRVVVVDAGLDHRGTLERTRGLGAGAVEPAAICLPADLGTAIVEHRPQAVLVVPGPDLAGRDIQRLSWTTESYGVPLLVNTRMQDVTPHRTASMRLGSLTVLYVDEAHQARIGRLIKLVWERLAALVALLALTPLFLVLAALIKVDSAGPVFFRQVRVGRGGLEFRIWKLRTMVTGAEALQRELPQRTGHVLFKARVDPRVTRVGRVLRKYSLDELPQLINVVLGDMALVGPRPGLPSEVERYDRDPMRRLAVAPGITGLWQVSGRSDLSWEDSVRLDLDYVDNWSLLRDLGIVVRTVRAVLRHDGAY